jgi:transcriptional regulator with XRE-family HTH domain
MISPYTVTPL